MSKGEAAKRILGGAANVAGIPGGSGVVSAFAEMAAAAGPVAAVVGGFAAAAAGAYAFAKTAEYFVERGKQLAPYSGELSAAGARAEVAGIHADIREAQQLGPAIARLTDAQTATEMAYREAMLPLKEAVLELITPVMEGLPTMIAGIETIVSWINGSWLRDAVKESQRGNKNDPSTILNFAFNLGAALPGNPAADEAQRHRFEQRAGAPVFAGIGGQ